MSKLETVKNFGSSEPQLQIIKQMKVLQQSLDALQTDLQTLPPELSKQITTAALPLLMLDKQVTKAVSAFDEVTQAQRQTLDAMLAEMSNKVGKSIEPQVEKLSRATSAAQELEQLPSKITKSAQSLTQAAQQLQSAAQELEAHQPSTMQKLMQTALAAMLGAVLVLGGQIVLRELLPNDDAKTMRRIVQQATPSELQLIQRIAQRPAN